MTLNQRIGRALARAFGYHYEASRITREHRHPIGATAQDSKLDASDADRTMLLKLSRYLCSNVGLVRGAISDLARYSVGTGIVPQAATQNEEWNTAAETFFSQWSLTPEVTGRHTFGDIQRLSC
jgi:capsid protein